MISAVLINSCKKDKHTPPIVVTTVVSEITQTNIKQRKSAQYT